MPKLDPFERNKKKRPSPPDRPWTEPSIIRNAKALETPYLMHIGNSNEKFKDAMAPNQFEMNSNLPVSVWYPILLACYLHARALCPVVY